MVDLSWNAPPPSDKPVVPLAGLWCPEVGVMTHVTPLGSASGQGIRHYSVSHLNLQHKTFSEHLCLVSPI